MFNSRNLLSFILLSLAIALPSVHDQIFRGGEGVVDGEGGSSERCLKWGGGGGGVIKGSFQKHLKTGSG